MNLLNPFSWFRKPEPEDVKPLPPDEPDPVEPDPERFARRAGDSGDEIMEPTSIRLPDELKRLGMRKARVMGLTLGEYMRFLLARDIDSDDDTVPEESTRRVTRNGGR